MAEKSGILWYIHDIISKIFILLLGVFVVLPVIIFFVFPIVFFQILKSLWFAIKVHLYWYPKGKYLLFVYSESPNWKEYIETKILPKISDNAVILNWSEHGKWNENNLEVQIFRHWANFLQFSSRSPKKPPWKEFCPLAVTFVPWWHPKSIRFWKAFKDFKHGKKQKLEENEKKLFEILEKKS